MKHTLIVKIVPSAEQKIKLLDTMKNFNQACNFIADIVFKNKTANKFRIQKMAYYDVKAKFNLPAHLIIRAISKVCEAYKQNKSKRPDFSEYDSIIYDHRILSWKGMENVSMSLVGGRETIPIIIGKYQKARFDRIKGQADFIYHNGGFFVRATIDTVAKTGISGD